MLSLTDNPQLCHGRCVADVVHSLTGVHSFLSGEGTSDADCVVGVDGDPAISSERCAIFEPGDHRSWGAHWITVQLQAGPLSDSEHLNLSNHITV